MRDPGKAKVAYQVFKDITTENLVTGAQKLAKVTDAHIDAIVDNSQIANKEDMKAVLKARRDAIVQKLLNKSQTEASEELGHPGQHQHAGHPGWHSIDLKHTNKVANAAHQKLGLPYEPPKVYIGSTLEPGQDIWSTVASSTTIPAEYKAMAKAALAYNFKSGQSMGSRQAAISQFLKDNGMQDKFMNDFNSWKGGSHYTANIRVAAALFELKGEATGLRESQSSHWMYTMGQSNNFNSAWDSGVADAMNMIPYVVASQQYIKAKHGDKPVTMYRGLNNAGTNQVASTVKKALNKVQNKENFTAVMPGGPGAAGWSEKKGTAESFAGQSGVVFMKKGLTVEDVLVHFNAFTTSHGGEAETIVDSNAASRFSYDEVLKGGIDY